jgi:hypothetical protein
MVNVVFAGRRCYTIDRLGMDDQDDCGKGRKQEFRHDPIEPEQAPDVMCVVRANLRRPGVIVIV